MFTLNCKGRLLIIDKPIIMGILNITPDSFYKGSRTENDAAIVRKAEQMIHEGASILDIGGQSTRPGSVWLSAEEEALRVLPAIQLLRNRFPHIFLSVDTFYAAIAEKAVAAGADLVNDISAGDLDADMLETVGKLNVPYVAMHMKGTPQTMQQQAVYEDVVREVTDYFIEKMKRCKEAGIKDLIIDPGFGFAKTIAQNFQLLRQLEQFHLLQLPLLAGLSRKSTIYKTLGISADEALNGTTVLNTIALLKGALVLRVHDVKEAAEAIQLVTAYQQA